MFERRIEEAGLNSWPALQQLLFDGWIIRFARGYTKRANSVTPIYPSQLSSEEKIDHCERFYEQKQLPTIFRLPSFAAESASLERVLEQRGYYSFERSHVWSTTLSSTLTEPDLALHNVSLASWLPIYCQFSTRYSELQHLHGELLERIPPPFLYAVLYLEGVPVACGLGVLEHEMFGIFDVVTDPAQRQKGYGTRLVTAMLAWGRQHGAHYAYLQVIETNLIAQQLYAKLGFQPCYDYWYLKKRNEGEMSPSTGGSAF
ncbi:GNAT family N-acetyltransferase [Dictyobacter arantiisoli]|nr:GNAT family N-acetyltransferase [Dictyobacter arantiisoli]